jgi:ABC-type cobalt transport system substrate-binding protein
VSTVGYAQIEFEPSSHIENALFSSDASIGTL